MTRTEVLNYKKRMLEMLLEDLQKTEEMDEYIDVRSNAMQRLEVMRTRAVLIQAILMVNADNFEWAEEKSKRELEEMLNVNPLLAYSTTQLKNELRRRKRNGSANQN